MDHPLEVARQRLQVDGKPHPTAPSHPQAPKPVGALQLGVRSLDTSPYVIPLAPLLGGLGPPAPLDYAPGRFSDIQRARNGKRWHGEYSYDFEQQARDVRELKAWGLKQITIGAVVGLSQGRVSQILSEGTL